MAFRLRWGRSIGFWGVVLAIGGGLGVATVRPELIRLILTILIIMLFVALMLKQPRTVLISLFVFLPFLGLLRRLLIPVAGWSGTDPLLVILPFIVGLLAIGGRRNQKGQVTKLWNLVTAFLVIAVAQVANPLQGGLTVGIGGAFMLIPPVLAFYVGNRLADYKTVEKILTIVQVIGVTTALYGIYQSVFGFLPVERDWLAISGYAALSVGGTVRAISTFVSAAEYAQYTAIAALISLIRGTTGRPWQLLLWVLFLPALFLESSRGIILTLLFASVAVIAAMGRRPFDVAVRLLAGFVAVGAAGFLLLGKLSKVQFPTSLAVLASHQINGFTNIANPQYSTMGVHLAMLLQGILDGFTNPIGYGLGSISIASAKFGGTGGSLEVDLSNAFHALGLAGGLVYAYLVITVVLTAWRYYRRGRQTPALAIVGILIVSIGQWWNGGYYVTAPMIWLLIGHVNAQHSTHLDSEGRGGQVEDCHCDT